MYFGQESTGFNHDHDVFHVTFGNRAKGHGFSETRSVASASNLSTTDTTASFLVLKTKAFFSSFRCFTSYYKLR